MADEAEGLETGAEASAAGVDPAAISIALGAAAQNERVAGKAEAFLEKQARLADEQIALTRLQAKELAHELKLRHWSLQLRHGSAILKFALEVSLALIGIALACFIGLVVWNAAHADGLIVESFSVPPDLAARGLTGQAIAGQLMDKLSEMQSATSSSRAPRSYSNNWGNEINVEIPETGVSVGEAYNFLKSWLGYETHVSGDVWRTQKGLAIVARVSNGVSNTVSGAETDLDGLIQKAAEDIYNRTQPYRYAQYLAQHGRTEEALALFKTLAAMGTPNDRGWAYTGLGNLQADNGDVTERERLYKEGQQFGIAAAVTDLAGLEINLGRPGLALAYYKNADAIIRSSGGDLDPRIIPIQLKLWTSAEALLLGDSHAAAQSLAADIEAGLASSALLSPSYILADRQILEHNVAGARKTLENPLAGSGATPGGDSLAVLNTDMQMAREAGDWKTVLADAQAMDPIIQKYPGRASVRPTLYDPLTAIAEARLGKFADAERRISTTPADCYPCLMARADIAEIQGQNARADWWYARAVSSNPSIPLAESDWGNALLERKDYDAAIAKFTLANQKGPHFADPLEGWGEALMAKNRSDLALAKFTEAEKYAPNWGRLHLKWGEALGYAEKPDEAKKQFGIAAGLDLVATDKAELDRMRDAHG